MCGEYHTVNMKSYNVTYYEATYVKEKAAAMEVVIERARSSMVKERELNATFPHPRPAPAPDC